MPTACLCAAFTARQHHHWLSRGQAAALLLTLSVLWLLGKASGKQSLYQGVVVGKHVPESVLPHGLAVGVIDVHYR